MTSELSLGPCYALEVSGCGRETANSFREFAGPMDPVSLINILTRQYISIWTVINFEILVRLLQRNYDRNPSGLNMGSQLCKMLFIVQIFRMMLKWK